MHVRDKKDKQDKHVQVASNGKLSHERYRTQEPLVLLGCTCSQAL
jgi:hypothetical protein